MTISQHFRNVMLQNSPGESVTAAALILGAGASFEEMRGTGRRETESLTTEP